MKTSFECDLKWNDLEGDSNIRRHCQVCDHEVYNLSGMTREQSNRVLELHRGRKLCARYLQRNGRIVHNADGRQLMQQKTGAKKLVAAAMLAQAAFLAFADNPGEFYYDPFAAIANIDWESQGNEVSFEEPGDVVVMGMTEF